MTGTSRDMIRLLDEVFSEEAHHFIRPAAEAGKRDG
jgi:hypothetical protein